MVATALSTVDRGSKVLYSAVVFRAPRVGFCIYPVDILTHVLKPMQTI
jgi:hypothetical protein